MKIKIVFLAMVATFAFCSVSKADINSAWWHDDGDGALVCSNWSFSGGDLSMQGVSSEARGTCWAGWRRPIRLIRRLR